MDGVIIDSMPVHMLAWEAYLRRHEIDPDGLHHKMHGRRNDEIVRVFWGSELDEQANFAHGAAKEALYREMMASQFEERLVPGAVDFVRSLEGGPKGLGSNAERANIDFTLNRAGLTEAFAHVVDGNEVAHAKPHPEIYLRLARELGVEPGDCIVFEDSPTGVVAARAAGMRVVGIDSGRVGLAGVELRVHDFLDRELHAWLEAQR